MYPGSMPLDATSSRVMALIFLSCDLLPSVRAISRNVLPTAQHPNRSATHLRARHVHRRSAVSPQRAHAQSAVTPLGWLSRTAARPQCNRRLCPARREAAHRIKGLAGPQCVRGAPEHAGDGQRRQREHSALRGARVERDQAQVPRLAVLVLHLRRLSACPQAPRPEVTGVANTVLPPVCLQPAAGSSVGLESPQGIRSQHKESRVHMHARFTSLLAHRWGWSHRRAYDRSTRSPGCTCMLDLLLCCLHNDRNSLSSTRQAGQL